MKGYFQKKKIYNTFFKMRLVSTIVNLMTFIINTSEHMLYYWESGKKRVFFTLFWTLKKQNASSGAKIGSRTYWLPLRSFIGYSEISNFDPQTEYFHKKVNFHFFQKVLFLGVWCRKLSLNKIGVMDMSYIIENKSNRLKTTFPNIFLLLSADPADLSKNQKKIIFPKKTRFLDQKCTL